MKVGVIKEIKNREYRVSMIPANVAELVHHGHSVMVQSQAGEGVGFSDQDYETAGAKIIEKPESIFKEAELIVKVKEPQPQECAMLREGQTIFTYLHLAPDPEQTKLLMKSGCIAIAYETVTDKRGGLPLLEPMSEVAGRLAIQAGAHCLEKAQNGRGVLLGGVPGVKPAKVVVIGGGVVGTEAIRMAIGMEASVTVIDKSLHRLKQLDFQFGSKLRTVFSTQQSIREHVLSADLVVGAVLVAGAAAPKLITREMVKEMQKGSVIVDVAIDQGGCAETSHATTHDKPTYLVDDVVHYCVANMPGAVPRTSTFALNNATLPFILALADKGYKKALLDDLHFLPGLNVYRGKLTNGPVGGALKLPYSDPEKVL